MRGAVARPQPTVVLAYAAFVLVGVTVGVSGVLLPAQIADYGVGQAAIGAAFFSSGAGFLLAGLGVGGAMARLGLRTVVAGGAAAYAVAALCLAVRPPFAVFVAVQVLSGFGTGLLESALNAYLTDLPGATARLGRLHAFFGVGALAGPPLAVGLLRVVAWPVVWLGLGVVSVVLLAGLYRWYPALRRANPQPGGGAPTPADSTDLLASALRQPAVVLAAVFLAVYVGLEISVGNWGFTALVGARGLSPLLAGYTVSGFWLGLTLGRFLLGPFATRVGWTPAGLIFACLFGTAGMTLLVWLVPGPVGASIGLVLLGFCLGPIFPTTMAMAPNLTEARLVSTAIGVANGVSVLGGALLPWLAGVLIEVSGAWTLLPYLLLLALVQMVVWRMVTSRTAVTAPAETAG
jgi:fucose permease